MFKVTHDKCLAESVWEPTATGKVDFVEAWQIAGVGTCTTENYRHGVLNDWEIEDWLNQTGSYAPPRFPKDVVVEGGIRLLLCERTSYLPPGFSISKESYASIENVFHLPESTLEAIYHYQGVCSDHSIQTGNTENGDQLGIVIKVPHKIQVGTYVLSLSHDVSTGSTAAFIHGDGVLSSSTAGHKRNVSNISKEIHALIRATPSLWAHPLLLPTILLKNYMNRSDVLAWALDDQVVELESSIGVTFAGRLRRAPLQKNSPPTRSDMRKLTMATHTALTEIIFFSRVVAFTRECATYLLQTSHEIPHRFGPQRQQASSQHASHELQSTMKYIEFSSTSMQSYCSILKDRVHSQIQVLYSISAQTDNRLSARIAVSSGRDSTAMKTLAFITALFLPGTYIATLFSMSMFEWHASSAANPFVSSSSSSSSSYVISGNFWIYWATTIPLTIAVIVCWRLWWVHEDRVYSAQLAGEIDGTPAVDEELRQMEKSDGHPLSGIPLSGIFTSRKAGVGIGN